MSCFRRARKSRAAQITVLCDSGYTFYLMRDAQKELGVMAGRPHERVLDEISLQTGPDKWSNHDPVRRYL